MYWIFADLIYSACRIALLSPIKIASQGQATFGPSWALSEQGIRFFESPQVTRSSTEKLPFLSSAAVRFQGPLPFFWGSKLVSCPWTGREAASLASGVGRIGIQVAVWGAGSEKSVAWIFQPARRAKNGSRWTRFCKKNIRDSSKHSATAVRPSSMASA